MSIEEITREAGKTYAFDEDHEKGALAQHWFQHPPEGLTLFVVLYTMACRWSKCLACNLPSLMSQYHVPFRDIMMQVDYLFNNLLSDSRKKELKKIILSNNGSVLDEETFSTTALMYFIAKMNMHCPQVSVLSMETRPEYVDIEELEVISRALKEGETPTQLELAVGIEAFDEVIRNDYFHKGLSFETFEAMAEMIAKHRFSLKIYFMMKPVPGMSEEEAVSDIVNGIDYLDSIATRYSIDINMHLNPTYVASGTELEEAFAEGKFEPPKLESVRRAVLHAENKNISVFVGLNDEGLAVPGGGVIREGDEKLVALLEEFNHTRNYNLLKR
jgi:radical SAM enzyme (TIGR01210 family)